MGQYTSVVQTKVKTMVGKIRARSATAPNKIPTVTAANCAWNCAKSRAEMYGLAGDGAARTFIKAKPSRFPMNPFDAVVLNANCTVRYLLFLMDHTL